MTKSLDELRAEIQALEREGGSGSAQRGRHSLGWQSVDEVLGGGLMFGVLHEFAGGAALGFVGRQVAKRSGPVLWIQSKPASREGDAFLNPVALAQNDLDPARLTSVTDLMPEDFVWAVNEVLRTKLQASVLLVLSEALDLETSRRFQLAAEAGGNLVFALAPPFASPEESYVPSAVTRWQVRFSQTLTPTGEKPHPHAQDRAAWRALVTQTMPSFDLDLVKHRYGKPGSWLGLEPGTVAD